MAAASSGLNRFYVLLGATAVAAAAALAFVTLRKPDVSIPANVVVQAADTTGFSGYYLGSDSAPITVTLIGPDQVAPSTNPFVIGLSQGWEALQKSIGMLLTIIGAVLPFALVGGAIAWPLLRRHRTRAAARSEQPTE